MISASSVLRPRAAAVLTALVATLALLPGVGGVLPSAEAAGSGHAAARADAAARVTTVTVRSNCRNIGKSRYCIKLRRHGSRWWAAGSIVPRRSHLERVKVDWLKLQRYSCSSKRWLTVEYRRTSIEYSNGYTHRRTPAFDYDFSWTRWRAIGRFDGEESGWHTQRTSVAGSCR